MSKGFRQITGTAPKPMRPIAVIAMTPAELSADRKIRFRKDRDNLDSLRYALLELESGRMVGLVRHDGSEDPGTELHAPTSDRRHDLVLKDALAALRLTRRDVSWALPKKKAAAKKRQPVAA